MDLFVVTDDYIMFYNLMISWCYFNIFKRDHINLISLSENIHVLRCTYGSITKCTIKSVYTGFTNIYKYHVYLHLQRKWYSDDRTFHHFTIYKYLFSFTYSGTGPFVTEHLLNIIRALVCETCLLPLYARRPNYRCIHWSTYKILN